MKIDPETEISKIIDENGKVIHAELVPEIAQEPDYEAAIKALK